MLHVLNIDKIENKMVKYIGLGVQLWFKLSYDVERSLLADSRSIRDKRGISTTRKRCFGVHVHIPVNACLGVAYHLNIVKRP